MNEHDKTVAFNIENIGKDQEFRAASRNWLEHAVRLKYGYNFSWMGRPVIQVPQDIYAIQELVWKVKPDLIIETGIAHGGSLVLAASMLAQLDYCDAVEAGTSLSPRESVRRVIGVDIDIRAHNRKAIEAHPLFHLIEMVEGSSIDPGIVDQVHDLAAGHSRIMLFLDSNHTHAHVLAELMAYAPLVSKGSYCVVWDSGVDDLPDGFITDRPWGEGDNPKTALLAYLEHLRSEAVTGVDGTPLNFEIDKLLEHKLALSACSDGFLRRV